MPKLPLLALGLLLFLGLLAAAPAMAGEDVRARLDP